MADLPTGSTFAGYRIDGVAGRGGMGVVLRATDLRLDRAVALKLVSGELAQDEAFAARFVRESKIAASIDHPNVIPIYHAGEEDGRLYLTMRFVEGTDLSAVLGHDRRLDPERAVRIVGQVAAALDAAHARGLVHRDVKPGNVLIEQRQGGEHVFLTDFGLTKHAHSESALTETGTLLGTVDYVAPEQVEGGEVDGRADVYALGCVMFEMLTGRIPFDKPSQMAKLFAHVHEEPPSAAGAGVSEDLAAVVRRAMEKEPGRRWQSAGEFAAAAARAIGLPTAVTSAPVSTPLPTRARRRVPARWALAAVAAVAVTAIAAILLSGGSGTDDKAALTALIRHLVNGSEPADCRRVYTGNYLTNYYARPYKQAIQACINESGGGSGPPQPVVIRQLQVQGDVASAQTNVVGQPITVTFVKRAGHWRANDFTETQKGRFVREVAAAVTSSFKNQGVYDRFIFGRLPLGKADGVPASAAHYLDGAVGRLESLTPPAELSDVEQHLVTTLRAVRDNAHAAAAAQAAHDAAAYAAAERKLGQSILKFGAAEGELGRAQ